MRIAFFTDVYRPTTNGVVASIDAFATELRVRGHHVTIICPSYPDTDDECDSIVRIGAVTFPSYKEYRIASPLSAKIERHMKHHAYDLIHIHSPFSVGLAGMLYARRYRIPVVYTAHTDYAEYLHYVPGGTLIPEILVDKLAAKFSNGFDLTLAPSKKISDYLVQYGTKKDIAILPTGIPPMLKGSKARFKEKYSIERALTLLYIGRVTKEKNLEFLMRSFAKAYPTFPRNTILVIVGDGPYRDELEALSVELGVRETVVFTGFLLGQDKADAYAAGDIFCHVSYSETQGITLMEAASYGLPLLVSDDTAYQGVAVAGRNAVVVDENIDHCAKALTSVSSDKDLRMRLGAESKELARSFSIGAQTDTLVDLYEQVIKKKRVSVVERG